MCRSFVLFVFSFLIQVVIIKAQPIDNTSVYRNLQNKSYFRFYYDNDFFTATDDYYSQGINLEYVSPHLANFPLNKLLIKLKNHPVTYGVALEHLAYTPTSIRHLEIIYGDRPFASCLYFKAFAVTGDTIKKFRISSTINIGIIGNLAGGEWMQKTIHRNLNNIEPLGWEHQIKNDVVINYNFTYEKLLTSYKNNLSVSSISTIAAGTLFNNAGSGFCLMAGYFTNPFLTENTFAKNSQLKFYNKSLINFIGYDATLQGGFFNSSSPYIIKGKDLTRITFSSEAGINYQYKKIYLEYFQEILTKEFRTGTYHRWGGIRVGLGF